MYLSPSTFDRAITIPIACPQTELRRGKELRLATVELAAGQVLELRSLTLHLLAVLTPEAMPVLFNSALGLCSVGLYLGPMRCSGIGTVKCASAGAVSLNPFARTLARTPGLYTVVVGNNARNVDLSICATGSMRIRL